MSASLRPRRVIARRQSASALTMSPTLKTSSIVIGGWP
jgi:hypothetical protein